MKYEWLFFDLDNTLLDFDKSSDQALTASLQHFGIPPTPEVKATYHRINKACWDAFEKGELKQELLNTLRFQRLLETLGSNQSAEAFGLHYLQGLSQTTFQVAGAMELLQELSGHYQLAIVTNGLKIVQRPHLAANQMTHFFQAITVSEEIGSSKPNAPFFAHAMQEAGNPSKESVLVIGDSLSSDVKGGIGFGLDTCWFNPKSKTAPSDLQPTHSVQTLPDLARLLRPSTQ
ncbi:MAG: YjjG family noncanonical pyrimidine nucleotidase [Bacteroidota bacterium]